MTCNQAGVIPHQEQSIIRKKESLGIDSDLRHNNKQLLQRYYWYIGISVYFIIYINITNIFIGKDRTSKEMENFSRERNTLKGLSRNFTAKNDVWKKKSVVGLNRRLLSRRNNKCKKLVILRTVQCKPSNLN